jgi:hypothetical protein
MKPLIASLAVLAVLASSAAFAADDRCPIESLSIADIKQGISDAPTCDAALKMFQKCSVGTSGDVGIGAVVTEKCEAMFEGKLSAQQKAAYSRAKRVCDTKYAREDGTMYRSFEAFCRAQAAHKVATPFFQPKKPPGK